RALGETLWERFNAPKEEILWYYGAATETLRPGTPRSLSDELDRVVTELEQLALRESPFAPTKSRRYPRDRRFVKWTTDQIAQMLVDNLNRNVLNNVPTT